MMKLFRLSNDEWLKFLEKMSTQMKVVSVENHEHPFKETVFPPQQTLFYYRKDTPKEQPVLPENKVLYYGVKPCDAKTKKLLGCTFLSDPVDPYYQQHHMNSIVISKACDHYEPYCFCDQIGDSPGKLNGADGILFTLPEGYHLLVNHSWLSEQLQLFGVLFNDIENESAYFNRGNVAIRPPEPLPLEILREQGLKTALKMELWEEISSTCLGCGICTFLCPACYCFDIQDIAYGRVGKRDRTYDSCMFTLYSSEASGHNPRPSIKERWRQRLLHKFTYYPQQHGEVGCTGCGRCSKACPSKIDIREVIRHAAKFCE